MCYAACRQGNDGGAGARLGLGEGAPVNDALVDFAHNLRDSGTLTIEDLEAPHARAFCPGLVRHLFQQGIASTYTHTCIHTDSRTYLQLLVFEL